MNIFVIISYLLYLGIALLFMTLYYRGWHRLSSKWPKLISYRRLFTFIGGIVLFAIVISPLMIDSASYYLSVRAIQKVLISMIIPPLLWSSLPMHVILSGLNEEKRLALTRRFFRKTQPSQNMRKSNFFDIFNQPGVVWLIFISLFLIWHEPFLANWLIDHYWINTLFILSLLIASLLFWSQIVGTLPRVHRNVPAWNLLIALVAVEIPNMIAGVTVAFANDPIYYHYVNIRNTIDNAGQVSHNFLLTTVGDQRLSGCITWIMGTLVYVTAIMSVLNRLFKREKGLPPILSFSGGPDERTIAPGLEYRVNQPRWPQVKKNIEAK